MKHVVRQYTWCPAKIYKLIFRAFKMVNITEEDVKIFCQIRIGIDTSMKLKL